MINGENTKKFSWIIDWFYKGFLSGSSWSLFTVSSSPLFVNPFSSQCFYLYGNCCPGQRISKPSRNADQTQVDRVNPIAVA